MKTSQAHTGLSVGVSWELSSHLALDSALLALLQRRRQERMSALANQIKEQKQTLTCPLLASANIIYRRVAEITPQNLKRVLQNPG